MARQPNPMNFSGRFKLTELAWAAGFFDGEGCAQRTGYISQRHTSIRKLAISQATDDGSVPAVLIRFKNIFGVGQIYNKKTYNGNKKQFSYSVTSFEGTQFVLAALWKYLSPAKREQITHVLSRKAPRTVDLAELELI